MNIKQSVLRAVFFWNSDEPEEAFARPKKAKNQPARESWTIHERSILWKRDYLLLNQ